MNASATYFSASQSVNLNLYLSQQRTVQQGGAGGGSIITDTFQLSGSVSIEQSFQVVTERALDRLRQVVTDARAELGIPEGAALDTSAEATANRIADFALGAFEAFRRNHEDLGEEDAKAQFVDLIGGAIEQGIAEARDILSALQALTPEVDDKITTIADLVRQRLDAFLAGNE